MSRTVRQPLPSGPDRKLQEQNQYTKRDKETVLTLPEIKHKLPRIFYLFFMTKIYNNSGLLNNEESNIPGGT